MDTFSILSFPPRRLRPHFEYINKSPKFGPHGTFFLILLAQQSNLGQPRVALGDLWRPWETFGWSLDDLWWPLGDLWETSGDLWVTFGWPLGDLGRPLGDLWVTFGWPWETFGTLRSPQAKIDQNNNGQSGSRSINSVSKPMSEGCPIFSHLTQNRTKKSIFTD